MIVDLYKILDLDYKVSYRKLHKRFVELSNKYHPDFDKTDYAQQKFIDINIAYYILEYDDFRKQYDSLYKKEILKKISSLRNEDYLLEKLEQWLIEGKEKSQEYSKLTYKQFIRKIPKKESVLGAIISFIFEFVNS